MTEDFKICTIKTLALLKLKIKKAIRTRGTAENHCTAPKILIAPWWKTEAGGSP